MKLVMFDIDGTLTESNSLDNESYLQALHEVFGFSEILSDWTSYTHVTDACILKEVYQSQLGHVPSSREVESFQKRFLELLIDGAKARDGVKAVPGASDILKKLLASPDYEVAYAGGGWSASAIFKLKSANLTIENIPHAFSDDDDSREGIMAIARSRAEAYYGQFFPDVVYIGDGIWDIISAKNSGYSFIGIASGDEAQALYTALPAIMQYIFLLAPLPIIAFSFEDVPHSCRKCCKEGATYVFPNYDDSKSFLAALFTAEQKESLV